MKRSLFAVLLLIIGGVAGFAFSKYAPANDAPPVEPAKIAGLRPLLDSLGSATMATTYYAYCRPASFPLGDEQLIIILQNNVALRSMLATHLVEKNAEISEDMAAEFVLSAALGLQRQTINSLREDGCDAPKWQKMHLLLSSLARNDMQAQVTPTNRSIILPDEVERILNAIKAS